MVRAVEANTSQKWVVLYVKRWLKAPIQMPDGRLAERDRGTPQGALLIGICGFSRSRYVRSPAPHKHLHCAVGAEEVQAVEGVQASKTLVERAPAKRAGTVRPLGVDARVLTDSMRRAV
jgi:hypothetical protein